MNSFKSSHKNLLLIILLIGFILRINNLTIGFPGLYLSNDEAIYHFSALNMLAHKTPFTLGNYGPLGSYIQIPFLVLGYLILVCTGKVDSLKDMQFLLVTQEGYFMFIPRVLSALFGTLTILVIYRISLILFKKKLAALYSSFFTAVSFNLVHISHLARSLSPAIFFSSLSVLFAIFCMTEKERETKNRILSFFFAAVAFGFHQIAGIVVLFSFITLINFSQNWLKRSLVPILFWIILIFLINYLSLGNQIFAVFQYNNSMGLHLVRTPEYWLNKSISEVISIITTNLKMFWYLFLSEGIIILLAIYGVLNETQEKKIKFGFILLFFMNIVLSIFVFPPVLRYLLPIIVFFPVFAGVAAFRFKYRFRMILVTLLILSSILSVYWNYLLSRDSTFLQTRIWLEANIKPEIPIVATSYKSLGYVPSKTASATIREFKPGYYLRSTNLLSENNYPYNVRNIVYLDVFGKESKIDNLKTGISAFPAEYVIDAYYKESERLLSMQDNLELVAHFTPTDGKIYKDRIPELFADSANNFPFFILDRPGPYLDILKFK